MPLLTKSHLLVLSLLLVAFVTTASRNCQTFTVNNQSTQTIGDVYVTGSNQSLDMLAGGIGQYTGTACFTPTAVTINGQAISYPNSAIVVLPDNARISISWTSTDEITLADYKMQNSPVRQ